MSPSRYPTTLTEQSRLPRPDRRPAVQITLEHAAVVILEGVHRGRREIQGPTQERCELAPGQRQIRAEEVMS